MTYLITGAGRGLGLEFTRQLLNQKHNVIAWVRDPKNATALKNLEKQFSSQLKIQAVDISQEKSIQAAASQVQDSVDVLINNAGVLLDNKDRFDGLPKHKLEQTFAINVFAPMQVTQALLPQLQKSKTPLVANVSSLMGSITDNSSGGYYAYRMSKTALNMFTKTFSIDFPNIKMISLHPGWVQTDMGGSNATTTVEDSITGLLKVLFEHQRYSTGAFVNFQGQELPW